MKLQIYDKFDEDEIEKGLVSSNWFFYISIAAFVLASSTIVASIYEWVNTEKSEDSLLPQTSGVQSKKGEIRLMVQSSKSDGKPHTVQVYDIKTSEFGGKPKMSMRLSDGHHFIRGVTALIPDLKDFDIVSVSSYKITDVKGNTVMIVEKLDRLFTSINGLIGSPVDHKQENPNASSIVTTVPSSAKSLAGGSKTAASPSIAPGKQPVKEAAQGGKSAQKVQGRPPSGETKGVKPIKALGLYATDWTIKVRLLRKSEPKKFMKEKTGESQLMALEFIDDEGTQISATLFGPGVDKFQSILEPRKCYLVSNGNVKMANKKYTSIKTDYCINLDASSRIEETADDPAIPKIAYNFTPISKIADLPTGTVIDVIGMVREVSDMTTVARKDGTTTVRKNITVCDESGHSVELSFWGPLAEGLYQENELLGLCSVKVSEYNGKKLYSNETSTIVRDPEDPRAEKIRDW